MLPPNSNLNVVSLNTRGLRDSIKRKSIFLFCKNLKASCILLQETHSIASDENFWSAQWGEKIIMCNGTNKSAGVALLFKNSPLKIITHLKDVNGHWIICVLRIDDSFLILGNIYGYNIQTQNKLLLVEISDQIKTYVINTALIR